MTTFSEDGKWMWNGTEWIPAPPSSDPVPPQSSEQAPSNIKPTPPNGIEKQFFIIGMMLLCFVLVLWGQYGNHWINVGDSGVSIGLHNEEFSENVNTLESLRGTNCDLSQLTGSPIYDITCEFYEAAVMAGDGGSFFLWCSTILGGIWFLMRVTDMAGFEVKLARGKLMMLCGVFCGVSAIFAVFVWFVLITNAPEEIEYTLSRNFYSTTLGGFIGIIGIILSRQLKSP